MAFSKHPNNMRWQVLVKWLTTKARTALITRNLFGWASRKTTNRFTERFVVEREPERTCTPFAIEGTDCRSSEDPWLGSLPAPLLPPALPLSAARSISAPSSPRRPPHPRWTSSSSSASSPRPLALLDLAAWSRRMRRWWPRSDQGGWLARASFGVFCNCSRRMVCWVVVVG